MDILGIGIGVLVVISLVIATKARYFDRRPQARPGSDGPSQGPQSSEGALRHPDWQVRAAAVEALAGGDDAAIEALLQALEDADYDVRNSAREALVTTGKKAVTGLLTILADGSLEARQMAAVALGEIGSEEAVSGLAAALKSDHSMWVRVPAATALGRIGGAAAVGGLKPALDDSAAEVRDAAAVALRQINTPAARAALQQAGLR